ncbi:MAG: DUF3450 family protein [Spirochaetes bacterium]|nr:DUF3450 family protein [Spirochaetota bacterium]
MKKTAYLLILLLATALYAEDDKNYLLRKKIQESKQKIERLNKLTEETDKRIKDLSESHAKRIKKRTSDISELGSEIRVLEKELRNAKLQNSTLKNSVKDFELQFASYRNSIEKNMEKSRQSIRNNIPYNIEERNTNISKLISETEFESITPEEIFNRYYNFLNRELATGMDSEVYSKGNIKYLRIGWILLCYSDDQGKEAGILVKKNNKWEWKTDIDFSTRKAIRDSIKMVEGKKAPDLMEFPVPLSLLKETAKGGVK